MLPLNAATRFKGFVSFFLLRNSTVCRQMRPIEIEFRTKTSYTNKYCIRDIQLYNIMTDFLVNEPKLHMSQACQA